MEHIIYIIISLIFLIIGISVTLKTKKFADYFRANAQAHARINEKIPVIGGISRMILKFYQSKWGIRYYFFVGITFIFISLIILVSNLLFILGLLDGII